MVTRRRFFAFAAAVPVAVAGAPIPALAAAAPAIADARPRPWLRYVPVLDARPRPACGWSWSPPKGWKCQSTSFRLVSEMIGERLDEVAKGVGRDDVAEEPRSGVPAPRAGPGRAL